MIRREMEYAKKNQIKDSNIKMHWMGLTIDWIMKKKKKKISELKDTAIEKYPK